MVGPQGGTLNEFWAVRYGLPCQSQTGVITAYVEQEAPCSFTVLHQATCHTTLRAIGTCGCQWRLSCI